MDDVFHIPTLFKVTAGIIVICMILLVVANIRKGSVFVMCDVGNGDALYIRTASHADIVIDFGAHEDVLDCLGTYMPFMDRTIEFAFISHPHLDHYGGLRYVYKKYHIRTLIIPEPPPSADTYDGLIQAIHTHGTQVISMTDLVDSHTQIHTGLNESIQCVWPSSTDLLYIRKTEGKDLNAYSHLCVYAYGTVQILMTGDATPRALAQVQKNNTLVQFGHIETLKVPHHGSRVGLTKDFLSYIQPDLAVISVGSQNTYGHPSSEVLDMLNERGVSTYMTKNEGDIVIKITPDGTFSTQ